VPGWQIEKCHAFSKVEAYFSQISLTPIGSYSIHAMTGSENELIAFLEKAIDLGNPEQIKLYDDIMADTDRPSRLTKIGLFLMKHGARRPPTNAESSRLIPHIEHLLAVLQAFVSRPDLLGDVLTDTPPRFSPIPREFFQVQAERLMGSRPCD
jgi:hypothetical protein